jgi:threonine dehydrogenase-like Zn-dependent dehydrogenase
VRQAAFAAAGDLRVVDRPDPVPGPRDVLLNVDACGICGSDVASFLHGHYAEAGQVLGHEMACTVAAVGAEVEIAVGTRVAVCPARACGTCAYCANDEPGLCAESGAMTLGYGVPGGFADRVLYPDAVIGRDLHPVPADVPVDDLVWCEPLAVAVRAVRRTLAAAGGAVEHLGVLGAGSVGLCVAAAAVALGVGRVTVVEPRHRRRLAAAQLPRVGAEPGWTTALDDVEAVIDSSGSAAALVSVPAHLPLLLVGLGDGAVPWPRGSVETSFAYSADDFATAVRLVAEGEVRLGHLVTHRLPLDQVSAAIASSAHDPDAVKVVIVP